MKPGIGIKARVGLTLALLAKLAAVAGVLALPGLARSSEDWHDTCANEMFSQRAIDVAELYAAREHLVLDRAGFEIGTPEVAPTLRRARMMRGISDEWWKKYIDLPRGAEEDRFARAVSARRDALHEAADAFAAIILAGESNGARETC